MTPAVRFPGAVRIALAVGCLLALSACSAVRIAYSQLDWLIERRVAQYVSLQGEQHDLIEARIDTLLDWHCRTQLHGYAEWLRRVEQDFNGSAGAPPLRAHVDALQAAWSALMARTAPAVAELAGSLTDRQVAELLAAVERDNEEYRDDYVEVSTGERRRDRAAWVQDSLQRWLGPLTPQQQQALQAWSQRVSPMGEAGLANRMRWRAELADVLARRSNPRALAAGVERLMLHWRDRQTGEYRRLMAHNTGLFIDLLERIRASMTPRQERRLSDKLLGYAADMDALSCRATETTAGLGLAPSYPGVVPD